jgi:hypothetical protein
MLIGGMNKDGQVLNLKPNPDLPEKDSSNPGKGLK